MSFLGRFSNSYRVNLTCFAKEANGTDYGINSIVIETKVVGPIVFPEDPVPEENYLRFMVLGQNKIELIDSPDYNSGTHQYDQLYAQMDGFALKKLNWDESVDEEVYYYIDSESFRNDYYGYNDETEQYEWIRSYKLGEERLSSEELLLKIKEEYNLQSYFMVDEINGQYDKFGIVVANVKGSKIELITSNIDSYLEVTGKSKSIFTFALPRREVINGTAQILDIYDSVTYEYWME